MSEAVMKCAKCGDACGWICEAHPDKPWPHDGCGAPGTPCDEPGCEHSLLGTASQASGVGALAAELLRHTVPEE